MANVERAAPGAGGAGLPISAEGDATAGTVESGPGASHQGTNPAFAGLTGESGAGRTAVFGPAAHARLFDAKRRLSAQGYTEEQIADVEERQGASGLEHLQRASSVILTVSGPEKWPDHRPRMIEIALREGGPQALQAISQHGDTLFDWHTSISIGEALDLANQPQGATKLTTKAREMEGLPDRID